MNRGQFGSGRTVTFFVFLATLFYPQFSWSEKVEHVPREKCREGPKTIRVRNNHSFSTEKIPITVALDPGVQVKGLTAGDQKPLVCQVDRFPEGQEVSFVVDMPAKSDQIFQVTNDLFNAERTGELEVVPGNNGSVLTLRHQDREIGKISLGLMEGSDELLHNPLSGKIHPFNLRLMVDVNGPVRRLLRYQGRISDYDLSVEYSIYHQGFVDLNMELRQTSAEKKNTYLALIRSFQPREKATGFHSRHEGFIEPIAPDQLARGQRGLDWIHMESAANWAILNDVTHGWMKPTPDGRYSLLCNHIYAPQRAFEKEGVIHLVTDITGPAGPREEYDQAEYEFITPGRDAKIRCASRVILSNLLEPQEVDRHFLLYAGYQNRKQSHSCITLNFGVDKVEFGVAYFPQNTYQEDFLFWKMNWSGSGEPMAPWGNPPWQLAPLGDEWKLFKDYMSLEFKIMNALGMTWVKNRVYFEVSEGYADFYLNQARKYGMDVIMDFAPERRTMDAIDRILRDHDDIIRYVQLGGECLMGAVPPGNRAMIYHDWRVRGVPVYRYVAPAMEIAQKAKKAGKTVMITGEGCMFDVPRDFQIPFDVVDRDFSFEAADGKAGLEENIGRTAGFRDIMLPIANYASKTNLEPMATDLGWIGGLTELSDEDRAQVAYHLFDHVASQNCATRIGKTGWLRESIYLRAFGKRHYELLRPDATPTGEALAYRNIIKKYASPDTPINQLDINVPGIDISEAREHRLDFSVKNTYHGPIQIKHLALETPDEIDVRENTAVEFSLEPGESKEFTYHLRLKENSLPGYYHVFPVARYYDRQGDRVLCGWGILSHKSFSSSDLNLAAVTYSGLNYIGGIEKLREIDFHKPSTVSFGENWKPREIEWAYLIHRTLHGILGEDKFELLREDYVRKDKSRLQGNLILIGNPQSCSMIRDLRAFGELKIPARLDPAIGAIQVITNPWNKSSRIMILSGNLECVGSPGFCGLDVACGDFVKRYIDFSRFYHSKKTGITEVFIF